MVVDLVRRSGQYRPPIRLGPNFQAHLLRPAPPDHCATEVWHSLIPGEDLRAFLARPDLLVGTKLALVIPRAAGEVGPHWTHSRMAEEAAGKMVWPALVDRSEAGVERKREVPSQPSLDCLVGPGQRSRSRSAVTSLDWKA